MPPWLSLLISLSEFTRPSRIVFGDGSFKREGMASVIQWMVNNREKGYFKNLEYFQISGHKAASFEGSNEMYKLVPVKRISLCGWLSEKVFVVMNE